MSTTLTKEQKATLEPGGALIRETMRTPAGIEVVVRWSPPMPGAFEWDRAEIGSDLAGYWVEIRHSNDNTAGNLIKKQMFAGSATTGGTVLIVNPPESGLCTVHVHCAWKCRRTGKIGKGSTGRKLAGIFRPGDVR